MLFAEGNSANARRVASIVDGRAQGAMQNGRDFPAEQLLERGFGSDEGLNWVICPLSFESQQLGFVAFVRSDILSFIYEALANQLSAVLHSLLLIRQIEAAELAAANQATRISDLVRPMIETIGAAGALAREQGSTMAKLVSANAETARRLGESERHVEEMQQDLKRIIALTGTIDDLSETINVIAINAAIAAARAGSDGKVFGVISSEIRRLSVQTKTSTAEISSCLSALSTNSESFFDANGQTREVFSHLEEEIRTLLGSLESIQASMSDMTGKAQLVLATMGERK
jgi:methyl-accepting chemotaxis protein